MHCGIHYSMKYPPAIYCNVSDSSLVLYTAFDVSRYQVKSRFSYTSSASSYPSWGVRGSRGIVKQVNLQYRLTRAVEIKHWACACEMRARCHQVLHSWTEHQQNIYQPVGDICDICVRVCVCVRERFPLNQTPGECSGWMMTAVLMLHGWEFSAVYALNRWNTEAYNHNAMHLTM